MSCPAITGLTDCDLYRRGAETLVASWDAYARGATDAAVHCFRGVAAAVFPNEPERAVYNNAFFERGLTVTERADALAATEAAYDAAGVTRFAAWMHESDEALRTQLERRGYALEEATRAMGMLLDEVPTPRRELEVVSIEWDTYLQKFVATEGLLSGVDPTAFHVLSARVDGDDAATAIGFDHDADCGIYNVETLEHAWRRGLATAVISAHLHDAVARGCLTASVQSTQMAERVYPRVGFRDLGRVLEYASPT